VEITKCNRRQRISEFGGATCGISRFCARSTMNRLSVLLQPHDCDFCIDPKAGIRLVWFHADPVQPLVPNGTKIPSLGVDTTLDAESLVSRAVPSERNSFQIAVGQADRAGVELESAGGGNR